MIDYRDNGVQPSDLEDIVGRIVMTDFGSVTGEYRNAQKVVGVSGKSLHVVDLKRRLDETANRFVYTAIMDRPVEQASTVQMRSVKVIMDSHDEVNELMAFMSSISDEYAAFLKAIPERKRQFAQEMAAGNAPAFK